MLTVRKMTAQDKRDLYPIALRAFAEDYELYHQYPPLILQDKGRLMPPRNFGLSFFEGDKLIGGAFVTHLFSKGKIASIFLDPDCQGRGYGRAAMQTIEGMYPKVKVWKLQTPDKSFRNHRFYESLGYVKTGEEVHGDMVGWNYEKVIG